MIRRFLTALTILTLGHAPALPAQTVELTSGEVMSGTVIGVAKNRVTIKTATGSPRKVPVREVECARAADGTVKRYAAALVDGPTPPEASGLLARLQKGEALPPPEILRLAEGCTAAVVDDLKTLLTSKIAAVRSAAACALASAATPETVKPALEAALTDAAPTMLREVASALMVGAGLAALSGANAQAVVERGFTSKDRFARSACAWVAAKLGSKPALPVLATFLNDPDHHVQESSAVCLAECGNDAGAKVLMAMARRDRSPALDANRDADESTKKFIERAERRERIAVCELLGRLRHAPALPVLRPLASGKDADLAAAAKKAIEQIETRPASQPASQPAPK